MSEATSTAFTWSRGSDHRHPLTGLYEKDGNFYPSVTTVLDQISDMSDALTYFQAQYTVEASRAAKNKQHVQMWHPDAEKMIEVLPYEILGDILPCKPANALDAGEGVYWKKNAGLWHLQEAGHREMRRLANRGQIVHDAIEEWASMTAAGKEPPAWSDPTLADYVASKISARDFAITLDFCFDHVITALKWLQENVKEVHMYEAPVFNDTYCYAGTTDLLAELHGHDGVWIIDAKCSKDHRKSHQWQLAAYKNAEFVGIRNTDICAEFPGADRAANLYIYLDKKPGVAIADCECKAVLKEWFSMEQAFEYFLHARMVWQGMNDDNDYKIVKSPKVNAPKPGAYRMPQKQVRKLEKIGSQGAVNAH